MFECFSVLNWFSSLYLFAGNSQWSPGFLWEKSSSSNVLVNKILHWCLWVSKYYYYKYLQIWWRISKETHFFVRNRRSDSWELNNKGTFSWFHFQCFLKFSLDKVYILNPNINMFFGSHHNGYWNFKLYFFTLQNTNRYLFMESSGKLVEAFQMGIYSFLQTFFLSAHDKGILYNSFIKNFFVFVKCMSLSNLRCVCHTGAIFGKLDIFYF